MIRVRGQSVAILTSCLARSLDEGYTHMTGKGPQPEGKQVRSTA